jgi:CBS domain-containing protein
VALLVRRGRRGPRKPCARGPAARIAFALAQEKHEKSQKSALAPPLRCPWLMSSKTPHVRHTIALVQVVGGDGTQVDHIPYVACARRGETVSIEACGHCPHYVGGVPGSDSVPPAVECLANPFRDETEPVGGTLTLSRVPISVLMTRNVLCVRADLSLDAASALFLRSGHTAFPVVDDAGRVIGFVDEEELTAEVQIAATDSRPNAPVRTVGDIILPYVLALPETASVTRAASVMAFEGQQRIAVIGSECDIVGVLSASDILQWLARADGWVLPRTRPR